MQQIELLEAQDSPPAPGQVRGGCTPHPAQPDDDRVVAHPVIMVNGVNAAMRNRWVPSVGIAVHPNTEVAARIEGLAAVRTC